MSDKEKKAGGKKEKVLTNKEGVKFYAFTSEFENFEGEDQKHTFHFAKPGRRHIITLSKAEKAKQFDSLSNVLRQLVHDDQREGLVAVLKSEAVLTTAFAQKILERCGANSVELGNS
jgi:hypothetical protein